MNRLYVHDFFYEPEIKTASRKPLAGAKKDELQRGRSLYKQILSDIVLSKEKKKKVVPSVLEVGGSIDNSSAEVQGDEVTNPMNENSSGTTLSDTKDTNSFENPEI